MCFFCVNFCLIRLFTAGTTGWVGRTYIALSFSVRVGNALVYPKIVTISTISCVGRTVIYLSIIYFWLFWSFTGYLSRSIRLVLLVVTYLFPLTL